MAKMYNKHWSSKNSTIVIDDQESQLDMINNSMKDIELIVINFFNNVGTIIIDIKETDVYPKYYGLTSYNIDGMKHIAENTNLYQNFSFNYGPSAEIANKLWNANIGIHPDVEMKYQKFIDGICKEYKKLISNSTKLGNKSKKYNYDACKLAEADISSSNDKESEYVNPNQDQFNVKITD